MRNKSADEKLIRELRKLTRVLVNELTCPCTNGNKRRPRANCKICKGTGNVRVKPIKK